MKKKEIDAVVRRLERSGKHVDTIIIDFEDGETGEVKEAALFSGEKRVWFYPENCKIKSYSMSVEFKNFTLAHNPYDNRGSRESRRGYGYDEGFIV